MSFFRKRNRFENFLNEHHLIKPRRRFWPKALLVFFVLIFIISLVFFVPAAASGYQIYAKVKNLDTRAGLIMAEASQGNLKKVSSELFLVREDVVFIKAKASQIGPILSIPSVGKTSRTLDQMLAASIDLIDGYSQLLSVFSNLSNSTDENRVVTNFSSPEGRKAILQSIANNRDVLEKAKLKINAAKLEMAAVNTDDLTGVFKEKVNSANQLLTEIVGQSEVALPFFKYLPELAGLGVEKNYLILFQNNWELRPTGGFIGSYGVLSVKDGEIISMKTDDVYNLDKYSKDKLTIPAPLAMSTYTTQKYLFLRDANWSPDWPTDARLIDWLWGIERKNANLPEIKLDGIIALTPDFISNFLELTGPITVDGMTFDHQNFTAELEQAVEFSYIEKGIDESQRKNIIGDLSRELMSRLLKSSGGDLLKIWGIAKRDIEEKQIIMWMADPTLQKYISAENWSGEVKAAKSDYWYIVDANLAALKTDSVMTREAAYNLNLNKNGDLIGNLSMTYNHTGVKVPGLITQYRTYTRIYVPDGTEFTRVYLKDTKGVQELIMGKEAISSKELGKQYLSVYVTVEAGASKIMVLEYKLPEKIKNQYETGRYELLVQKQPGTAGHKLKIDLKFDQLITAYYADQLPSKFMGRNLFFDTDLRVDREIKVKF